MYKPNTQKLFNFQNHLENHLLVVVVLVVVAVVLVVVAVVLVVVAVVLVVVAVVVVAVVLVVVAVAVVVDGGGGIGSRCLGLLHINSQKCIYLSCMKNTNQPFPSYWSSHRADGGVFGVLCK